MLFTNRAFDLFDDMFNDPFFTRSYETTTTPQIMKADVQEIEKGYLLDIENAPHTQAFRSPGTPSRKTPLRLSRSSSAPPRFPISSCAKTASTRLLRTSFGACSGLVCW